MLLGTSNQEKFLVGSGGLLRDYEPFDRALFQALAEIEIEPCLSGLPPCDGDQHVTQIAHLALNILANTNK